MSRVAGFLRVPLQTKESEKGDLMLVGGGGRNVRRQGSARLSTGPNFHWIMEIENMKLLWFSKIYYGS